MNYKVIGWESSWSLLICKISKSLLTHRQKSRREKTVPKALSLLLPLRNRDSKTMWHSFITHCDAAFCVFCNDEIPKLHWHYYYYFLDIKTYNHLFGRACSNPGVCSVWVFELLFDSQFVWKPVLNSGRDKNQINRSGWPHGSFQKKSPPSSISECPLASLRLLSAPCRRSDS